MGSYKVRDDKAEGNSLMFNYATSFEVYKDAGERRIEAAAERQRKAMSEQRHSLGQRV